MIKRHPYLINKTFKSYLFATILASISLSLGVAINSVIVGNLLGPAAFSALNLSVPVIQFFNALYLLVNVGGAILIATAIGKRKFEEVNHFFSLSMVFNLAIGIVVIISGIFFLDELVRLLCSNNALQPLVKEYVRIILFTAPVYLVLPGLCVYVRTDSNPKLASIALIVANLVNLGLTILFISVFSMGIQGASLATAIGFITGIAIASSHFLKKERMIHFVKPLLSKRTGILLLTGLPLALASVLLTVRLLSVNHIVLHSLGASGISILAVCFNILMISSMFISGTVQTMQPIASVLLGSEDYKGVRMTVKAALKTLAVCLLSLLLLLLIVPEIFTSLFGLSGSALLAQSRIAIRLFAFCIPLFGLNYLIMAVFQLSGRNNLSILVSCTQALMVIPIMLAAVFLNNEILIWLSFLIGELIVFSIIWIISNAVRRKKAQLSAIFLIDTPQENDTLLDFSVQSDIAKIGEFTASVHQFLLQKEMDKRSKNAIEVCGEELVLNIMQHALAHKKHRYIDIRLRLQPNKALLCITDDGPPFDPIKYDHSGIGLLLVKKLCTNIQYSRSLNRNVVVVERADTG